MKILENTFDILTPTVILAFLLITFLQSGMDKLLDWKGNLNWLKAHFSKTFLKGMVPLLLGTILVLELITTGYCILGIYDLIANSTTIAGVYACLFSCITLLMLLFGQRVAKDYAGALTITCYFIVAVFGLYSITL